MKGDRAKEQQRGDKQVDTDNFNQLVRAGNQAGKIIFDEQYFQVHWGPDTQMISLDPDTLFEDAFGGGHYHFQVEQAGSTSLIVRGGRWVRHAGDEQATLALQGTLTEVDDLEYIGGATYPAGSTLPVYSYYALLTLGATINPIAGIYPDSLTASLSTIYPSADALNCTICIARIDVANNGTISAIEQYWKGGDIEDFMAIPDTRADSTPQQSLDYVHSGVGSGSAIAGAMQIYGFDVAASAGTLFDMAADLFLFREAATQSVAYLSWDDFMSRQQEPAYADVAVAGTAEDGVARLAINNILSILRLYNMLAP